MTMYIEKFLGGNNKLLINNYEIELEPIMASSSSFPFSKLMELLEIKNKVDREALSEQSAKQAFLLRFCKALLNKLGEQFIDKEDEDVQMLETPQNQVIKPSASYEPPRPMQTFTVLPENPWVKPKKVFKNSKKVPIQKAHEEKAFKKPSLPKNKTKISRA